MDKGLLPSLDVVGGQTCKASTTTYQKTNAAKFEGGATRSHHAPQYELTPKAAIDRMTARLEYGAGIHGPHNFRSGGQEFVNQCARHLQEHVLNFMEGDTSDDHLGAILANAGMLAHFETKGLTPNIFPNSPKETL